MLFSKARQDKAAITPDYVTEVQAILNEQDRVIQRMQTVGLPTDEQIKTWVKGRITPRVLTHV